MENKDDPFVQKIKNIITNHKNGDQIKLWGYYKNVNKLLIKADFGLMCSEAEAFGRVTVEYMQHGVIAIGNNTAGTSEIINDKINGFLYQNRNIDDLIFKMKYCLEKPNEMNFIRKKAYQTYLDNFTICRCTDEIEKLDLELM